VPREDVDVCEEISEIFNRTGIDTVFNAETYKVSKNEGYIHLHYRDKLGGDHRLQGTHLLVAVGRKPSSNKLGLEEIGVKKTKEGFVEVNEYFETSVKDVYALGDVAGSPPFTHMAFH